MQSLSQDVLYALRVLRKSPGFTLVAVLTLALGIGAVTIIFGAIYAVFFNTFPYKNFGGATIFEIHDATRRAEGDVAMSLPAFLDYRSQNQVFEDMVCGWGGLGLTDVAYQSGGEAVDYSVYYVSANLFEFMGVAPLLGRWATPDDTKPSSAPVFVMSYRIWRQRFDGSPKIVGKSFTLNGVSRILVGIMPPRFRWGDSDIWIPFSLDRGQLSTNPIPSDANVWPIARLKPDVSLRQAEANLNVVAHAIAKSRPNEFPRQFYVTTAPFRDNVIGPFKKMIPPLVGAVVMLLLISSSNVANMLLARAAVREKEVAVRLSLGATRHRLVQQFTVESLVLATAACVAGCFLAWIGIRKLIPLVPYDTFPPEAVFEVNSTVLLFAVGTSLITTLICGVVPTIRAGKGNIAPRLAGVGARTGLGSRTSKLRGSLVISEVALSILLLIGAGLMLRTFVALVDVKLGFDPGHILVGQLILPSGSYENAQQTNSFYGRIIDRIDAVPGVAASTISLSAPPRSLAFSRVTIPGSSHAEPWTASLDLCGEGYFRTLGLSLLYGRLLSKSDIGSARQVAVINHLFAERYLTGQNPIGRKIKFDSLQTIPGMKDADFEVVGVVSDVTNGGVRNPPLPEAYIPYTLIGVGFRFLLVRSAINPNSLVSPIRGQIWAVNPDVTLSDVQTIEAYLREHNYAEPKFDVTLLGTLGSIGLMLMAIGVFGVMSYSVALQTHEIGIRMALGAQQSHIVAMILRRGLGLVASGMLIGTVVSLWLVRFMKSHVWGVSTLDPGTFVVVPIVVLTVGLTACLAPMYRAMRVEPIVSLRHE